MAKKTSGKTTKTKLSAVEKISITPEDVKSVSKVNYPALKKMLKDDEVLIAVKNDSKVPLVQDWNLDLLPSDIDDRFNLYLQDRYVQYELKNLMKGARVVTIFFEGRTINFLNGFLGKDKFPALLSRPFGKETELRSSFVLNAGETVILTEMQANALRKFEKIKRTWGEGSDKKETPWLGFLVMKTIKKPEDLFKYELSYVTEEDTRECFQELKEAGAVYTRRQSGIIREEE